MWDHEMIVGNATVSLFLQIVGGFGEGIDFTPHPVVPCWRTVKFGAPRRRLVMVRLTGDIRSAVSTCSVVP